jgi:4-diphosphocytidyl-2-C-methyl-D-erythritol kinase
MQYATGIGDQLMSLPPLLDQYYFLLIFPEFSISTPWAYKEYKNYLENQSNESNFVPLSDKVDFSLWRNDFEKVVLSTYPEIKQMKNDLQNSQSLFAALSGSGSTMFGVYDNLELATNARSLFKDFQTCIALPVN